MKPFIRMDANAGTPKKCQGENEVGGNENGYESSQGCPCGVFVPPYEVEQCPAAQCKSDDDRQGPDQISRFSCDGEMDPWVNGFGLRIACYAYFTLMGFIQQNFVAVLQAKNTVFGQLDSEQWGSIRKPIKAKGFRGGRNSEMKTFG